MKVVVFGLLLLSLLMFGCAGGAASHTGAVSSSDISSEDLAVSDLSIDLGNDDTALPEQVG